MQIVRALFRKTVKTMTNEQKRVKAFMQMFAQETPEKPTQINEKITKLRANLILEEVFETICKGLGLSVCITDNKDRAIVINKTNLKDIKFIYNQDYEVDLVELADGIGDIMVVGLGTSIAAGIDQEPINKEIFNSNDSKAWKQEDLEKAKELYPTAREEHYGSDLYRLIREDGKVIKSSSYMPAKIKEIIEQQQS